MYHSIFQPTQSPSQSPSRSPSKAPSSSPSKEPTSTPSQSLSPTGLCEANPVELYDGSSLSGVTVIDTEIFNAGYSPWQVDNSAGCGGTGSQFTAGLNTGVERFTTLSIPVPAGATSVQYYYTHQNLDGNDDFIIVWDAEDPGPGWSGLANYLGTTGTEETRYGEGGADETCVQVCLPIPAGTTTLDILCKTRGNTETCSIDQIQFFDTSGRRRKLSGSDPSDAQSLSHPPPPPPVTIASNTTRTRKGNPYHQRLKLHGIGSLTTKRSSTRKTWNQVKLVRTLLMKSLLPQQQQDKSLKNRRPRK